MLTQVEADHLLAMSKRFADMSPVTLRAGQKETRQLTADGGREIFSFDLWRGTLRLTKARLQTRGRVVYVLARLDIDGAPHTNPDGKKIEGTHLHLYKEGFDDKWAEAVDRSLFIDPESMPAAFGDFCRLCRIEAPPVFQATIV